MNRSIYPQDAHRPILKQQDDIDSVWAFENRWQAGLCSCKPRSRCCFACCCSCCMGCKLAKYLGEASIIGCCPCSLAYLRTKLRTMRRIEGNCYDDVCISDCCAACVATQMAYELESQGLWDTPKVQSEKEIGSDRSYKYWVSH